MLPSASTRSSSTSSIIPIYPCPPTRRGRQAKPRPRRASVQSPTQSHPPPAFSALASAELALHALLRFKDESSANCRIFLPPVVCRPFIAQRYKILSLIL